MLSFQRLSKTCLYEKPYNVTGIIVGTGLEEIPKGICSNENCPYVKQTYRDRLIGTWKVMNVLIKFR